MLNFVVYVVSVNSKVTSVKCRERKRAWERGEIMGKIISLPRNLGQGIIASV